MARADIGGFGRTGRIMTTHNNIPVLIVEDDEIDAEAIQRAFQKHKVECPVEVATDGLFALARLRGDSENPPFPRPCLILLDLNMPRMNGIEFLQELRNDPDLCDSIVFVLTTSDAERDKIQAYQQNVAGYLVKSRLGDGFSDLIGLLNLYCKCVEFPPPKT